MAAPVSPASTEWNLPNVQNVTVALMSCNHKGMAISAKSECQPLPWHRAHGDLVPLWYLLIKFEAWLPKNRTGRSLSTGNGALGSCVQYEDLGYASSLGFAAVATDNSHEGQSGLSFLSNPDVIGDFTNRALTTGAVVGKDFTKFLCNRPHTKSYYLGCSAGGRQGLKRAQACPGKFDGIGTVTFIPMTMWPTIHDDILDQCGELDGVNDGFLKSPDLYDYKPESIFSGVDSNQKDGCLTEKQVEALCGIAPDRRP
ncbi:tannase and feruloyl esterase [Colletotrichum orchidophilum]|uniref:Carboxylic ester hydrolase n=1 Tax=Colletotrichum orchidophilum TaxID=1209926 RepID=A0A1G4BKC5_9PEZI|nr:tannase and feruloyl esterase [Colletotrichum orchidophilum]OHF01766.1 tannase and feruloyl esterase [Colletotrichum orchidophilum]